MGKMIKVVFKKGTQQLRHRCRGQLEWHFEGDGPFEVSREDYESELKPWFDIYKPSAVKEQRGGKHE